MKESISFSKDDKVPISLNFEGLREIGLSHLQKLSGDHWTDYNAHDPGVTILEQLCYALTDMAYRTSLPIASFLAPPPDKSFKDALEKSPFFAPSEILTSPPVTLNDIRKVIINAHNGIENVWLGLTNANANAEGVRGTYTLQILPKLDFRSKLRTVTSKQASSQKEKLVKEIKTTLRKMRNLGEDFDSVTLLEKQDIILDFQIHIANEKTAENTIAELFIKLFDFIYRPVYHYSFDEMLEAGYSVEEIFTGPRLDKGFIKNEELKDRPTTIHVDQLQKLFLKVDGVERCKVKAIKNVNGKKGDSLVVDDSKFFNIIHNAGSEAIESPFEMLFSHMMVFSQQNNSSSAKSQEGRKIVFHKEKTIALFEETWSKLHREYHLGNQDEFFQSKLKGSYRPTQTYHSIQNHFPLLYGIGKGLLPKAVDAASKDRVAKALQLKSYLLFFEKHLVNHLAQLGNVNDFFNINFSENESVKTYFSQSLRDVPDIEQLRSTKDDSPPLETEKVFFERKNRIYDHLLARFGEDLNELPWKIGLHKKLNKEVRPGQKKRLEDAFNREVLERKSAYLKTLGKRNDAVYKDNYFGIKGEDFSEDYRIPSGLEQLIMAKTGIPFRSRRDVIPKGERLYIVDHILLRDLLIGHDQKYGFAFINQHGNAMFQTSAAESWSGTEAERVKQVKRFYKAASYKGNYFPNSEDEFLKEGKCDIVNYKKDLNRRELRKDFTALRNSIKAESEQDKTILKEKLAALIGKYKGNNGDEAFDIQLQQILENSIDYLDDTSDGKKSTQMLKSFIGQVLEEIEIRYKGRARATGDKDEKAIIASYNAELRQNEFESLEKRVDDGKLEQSILDDAKSFRNLYRDTINCSRLFNDPKEMHTRLRLEELENKRAKGSSDVITQRRLVFKRKINIGKQEYVIDEDFFDFKISVILPNSPERFKDERFKGFVIDQVCERSPVHIANAILWVKPRDIKKFENAYRAWEGLKHSLRNLSNDLGDASVEKKREPLRVAAYEVYDTIKKLPRG